MESRSQRSITLTAALCLSLVAAGCSHGPAPAGQEPLTPAPARPAVEWGPCPPDVSGDSPQLQCATVPVPLDYRDSDGAQIDLMISRLPSSEPQQRRGVLLLNPGGPGGSGLGFSTMLAARGLPRGVLDRYDLIGMDTRGIGHSAPISCGFTEGDGYEGNIPPYAVDDAAVATQAEAAGQVAQRCAAHDNTGRLPHVTTANMARDLDRIRAAVGEEKASYLGYSYGASLGAAYASMFPETTDRIVLDSNYGDTHLDRDGLRRYALGMEQTFPDFAAWAAARHDHYGLGRTPQEVRRTYLDLARRLDHTPADGMNGGRFRLNTFVSLYNEASYEPTAQAWKSLLDSENAGSATDTPAPAPAPSPHDNMWSVFLAVTCNDVQWPEDIGTYQRAVTEDRAKYPLFGAAAANITPCSYWPHEPAEPPVAVNPDGPANVLIVQNQRDPVTPMRGGELLNDKFGDRSRLLGIDGSGHGGYILGNNACAREITTSYLVDGILPEHDTTCEAQ